MKLVPVKIKSIYPLPTGNGDLPSSMAKMTPDAAAALDAVRIDIEALGGWFRVSDMYRDSALQAKAHNDFVTGKKKAYSPPAGGSMHEAGRAIDLDLAVLIHPQHVPAGHHLFAEHEVREIFTKHGWVFIAAMGNEHMVDVKESWHIEYRAQFQSTYDNVFAKTKSHKLAYTSMAHAAIADLKAA
jgi:D-alanyl-D-alanine dipeptidase